MPEFVMHQKIDGKDRQILVIGNDESEFSSGTSPQEASGWKLSKADPEKVRDEAPNPENPPAEPVNPKNTKEK